MFYIHPSTLRSNGIIIPLLVAELRTLNNAMKAIYSRSVHILLLPSPNQGTVVPLLRVSSVQCMH